jgi:hypothetical protein
MKKLLFLLVFIPIVSFGQDYGNNADAIKLCTVLQTNNFGTDAEAEKGLDRILSVIGASKRFVLQPCSNINNAIAASYKGIRYIFYDRNFMSSVNSGNNWGNLFILAHEVGHHINGHSLDLVLYAAKVVEPKTLANKRKQELEADEFAGFILAKLGGSIQDANRVIIKISNNSDDSSSAHPNRDKRLEAVRNGFKSAGYNLSRYENLELNYSLISNNKNDIINQWDYNISKEKEIQLKDVSDPFKRMEIIDNPEIPDVKITSWVYGRIINDDSNINFTSPKFVIAQEKYDTDLEQDYYNNTSIHLYNSFFVQKIKSLLPSQNEKLITEHLNKGKFKFQYIFDDGTRGEFHSINIENKPWELVLDLELFKNDYKENLLQFYQKEYSYFLEKLKTQNKIFIRLIKVDNDFELFMMQFVESNKFIRNIKIQEFDLKGSSKALKF